MTVTTQKDMVSPRILDRLRRGQLTQQEVDGIRDFLDQVEREVFHHRIITDNAYTRWFQRGGASDPELVHFIRHLPQLTFDEKKAMEKLNPKGPDDRKEEEEEERFLNGDTNAPQPAHHHH